MIRGKMIFICTKCKKIFIAPDIEYCASVLSVPMPCPRCDSIRTMPLSLFYFSQLFIYKKIWKQMEENRENREHKNNGE